MRVLHICESFNPGGVVWWLIDMLKLIPSDVAKFDFYCCGRDIGMRGNEVTERGCEVNLFRATGSEVILGQGLRRLLRSKRYDIVHSHMFNLSGWMLKHAHCEGVPIRIAHYHNTQDGKRDTILRRVRRTVSRGMVARHANCLLACSAPAMAKAPQLRIKLGSMILHYGIDADAYAVYHKRGDLRASLGIKPETKLIGHVGRFYDQKNHFGLISIFSLVLSRFSDAHLILMGDGPLRTAVQAEAERRGIARRISFLGPRNDVAEILPELDAFAFPSIHEGLPVSVIEARMAGLPIVASNIPEIIEVLEGSGGYELIPHSNRDAFADAICFFLRAGGKQPPPIEWRSKFSRAHSANQLVEFYHTCQRGMGE